MVEIYLTLQMLKMNPRVNFFFKMLNFCGFEEKFAFSSRII